MAKPGVAEMIGRLLDAPPAVSEATCEARGWQHKAFTSCKCPTGCCIARLAADEDDAAELDELAASLHEARERAKAPPPRAAAAAAAVEQSVWTQCAPCDLLSNALAEVQMGAVAEALAAPAVPTVDEAVAAVNARLLALGCCTNARNGFTNVTTNYWSKERTRGGKGRRDGGGTVGLAWSKLRPVVEVLARRGGARRCCARDCTRGVEVAAGEALRAEYRAAPSSAAADLVLKRFLWDSVSGELRRYCNDKLRALVPVGTERLARCRAELRRDGAALFVQRVHGLVAHRQTAEGRPKNAMSVEQARTRRARPPPSALRALPTCSPPPPAARHRRRSPSAR
jgi:hypothetical protein